MAVAQKKVLPIGEYRGYVVVDDTDEMLHFIYENKSNNAFNLIENQYLMVRDSYGKIVDKYKWQDGVHKKVVRKSLNSVSVGKISPKNAEQEIAIDVLLDPVSTVKVLAGTFGSGKTLLGAACAFQGIQEGIYDKIVWIRNNVEVKDTNPIGHLKGSYYDKMIVWAMPLADHIGGEEALQRYFEEGKIEVTHLGFLRGRDIKKSIIICSEAEHLTRQHVQLLLGRVAEGSVLFLDGDWRQIDAKSFVEDNGLVSAIDRLKGNKLFSYVYLPESVRSETAKLADLLD